MRKLFLAVSTLAFAAGAVIAGPIEDRQANMKERGAILGGLSKVVKGEEAFDAAAVLTALQALDANAERFDIDALFPPGSDKGDTRASPKIWEDMAGFKAEHANYEADVEKALAAAPADAAALQAQLGAIGAHCGTCHQNYRLSSN